MNTSRVVVVAALAAVAFVGQTSVASAAARDKVVLTVPANTCVEKKAELATNFAKAGLTNVQTLPLAGPPWCGWMSYAQIGWKPLCKHFS